MIWETRDGREIEVKDMTNSHLVNAIKYCKKRAKEGVEIGGGQYYGEGEEDFWIDTLFGKEALSIIGYYGLLREARRRGGVKALKLIIDKEKAFEYQK